MSSDGTSSDTTDSSADAAASATAAAASATLAQSWASQATGLVNNSDYSAKYYAAQASTYAGSAQTAVNNASKFASNASTSATSAATSAAAAQASATTASQAAASLNNLIAGLEESGGDLEDIDIFAISRDGALYATTYQTLKASIQAGLVASANNLSDLADTGAALTNLGGTPLTSIASDLVTNTSTSTTVSVSYSFTPPYAGKLTMLAHGGSSGAETGSLSYSMSTTGCVLPITEQATISGFADGHYSAQCAVEAGVAVNVTLTQTAPADTVSNSLTAWFAYLPG